METYIPRSLEDFRARRQLQKASVNSKEVQTPQFDAASLELLDKNGKRKDGRLPHEVRPMFLESGLIKHASGSAYVEKGNMKVICAIHGPRSSKRLSYSEHGHFSVEVSFAPFSRAGVRTKMSGLTSSNASQAEETGEKDLALLLSSSLSVAIHLHAFPKSVVEAYVLVLQDGALDRDTCIKLFQAAREVSNQNNKVSTPIQKSTNTSTSTSNLQQFSLSDSASAAPTSLSSLALTCVSLALLDAHIPLYDVPVACESACLITSPQDKITLLDPSPEELAILLARASSVTTNDKTSSTSQSSSKQKAAAATTTTTLPVEYGHIYVSTLPSLQQVSHLQTLSATSSLTPSTLQQLVQLCELSCQEIRQKVIRKFLVEKNEAREKQQEQWKHEMEQLDLSEIEKEEEERRKRENGTQTPFFLKK